MSKAQVHILVSAPPNLAPSEMMRRLKGRSATPIFETYPELRKRYWGRHFWARGYFGVTSGEVTEEMIKEYLEHHFDPKPMIISKRSPHNGSLTRIRTFSP